MKSRLAFVLLAVVASGLGGCEGAESRPGSNEPIPTSSARKPKIDSTAQMAAVVSAFDAEDYEKAYALVFPLATAGNAEAQSALGTMYDRGLHVSQDYAVAVDWYRKSAEQDNYLGQTNLGLMYFTGTGVPQDYVQAHKWLNLASRTGGEFEMKRRDKVAELMTPAQIAEAQKAASAWRPK